MKIKSVKNKFSLESLTLDDMLAIRRSASFFLSNFDGTNDGFTKKQVKTIKVLNDGIDDYLFENFKQVIEDF